MTENSCHMTGNSCHTGLVNLGDAADLVLPRPAAQVIGTLGAVHEPMTMRGLARAAGITNTTAQHWINHFADRGLIQQRVAGRAILCSLNRDHLFADAIIALAAPWERIKGALSSEIAAWEVPPVSAVVFGSCARADGTVHSDIDMLLIVPDEVDDDLWTEQLSDAGQRLTQRLGNAMSWIDVTLPEFRKMVKAREPVTKEIARDGIHIFGAPLTSLLE
jgi:predicted nucleotidyltransferase